MFENMTYENVLSDAASRVKSDVDKREGSIIYDALAPHAFQLAQTYFLLDYYVDLFTVDTAIGKFLDSAVYDYGIIRKAATYAVRKIETSGAVAIGSRWGINDTSYVIKELISANMYSAICEQAGAIGNMYSGTLDNMDNITGATTMLTGIITPGSDEEEDEALRARAKEYLINPSQDGNVAQYRKWATEYAGIGTAKVFPLWNGGNTVKIAITDSNYLPAGGTLVAQFQEYIDPGAAGLGNGAAPIGSKVTVTGGTQKNITVAANVVLADGYSDADGAAEAIAAYLASVTFVKSSVSYMRIGGALLDCDSITDVSNLTVNGGAVDIPLSGEEIPVLANISLVVSS